MVIVQVDGMEQGPDTEFERMHQAEEHLLMIWRDA